MVQREEEVDAGDRAGITFRRPASGNRPKESPVGAKESTSSPHRRLRSLAFFRPSWRTCPIHPSAALASGISILGDEFQEQRPGNDIFHTRPRKQLGPTLRAHAPRPKNLAFTLQHTQNCPLFSRPISRRQPCAILQREPEAQARPSLACAPGSDCRSQIPSLAI
jgi:hypothetical protein